MLPYDTISVFLDVAEELSVGLIKTVVGTIMSHTQSSGHFGQMFELDDGTIGTHFLHLLAVFNVDVGGLVLFVMLDGESISRHSASAAETVHLRSDNIGTERAESIPVFDYVAVRSDDDGR